MIPKSTIEYPRRYRPARHGTPLPHSLDILLGRDWQHTACPQHLPWWNTDMVYGLPSTSPSVEHRYGTLVAM